MEETKNELLEKIESATTIEQLDEIEKEVEELADEKVIDETTQDVVEDVIEEQKEVINDEEQIVEEEKSNDEKSVETEDCEDAIEKKENIATEEERSLIRNSVECEQINFNQMEERKTMENQEREYRNAWAKTLMGVALNESEKRALNEVEKRALGDAVTTTATTFVQSTADTQGINNGGLVIPKSFRDDFLKMMEDESPIFRDARKLAVAGNVEMAYLFGSDDAQWYAELTDTSNEGIEFKSLQLTGFELAKDIVITWKLEEMSVESFIGFLMDELRIKMGAKLIDGVIYGDGSGKPSGVTNGLTPVTTAEGDSVVDKIVKAYKSLDKDAKRGAKAYVSVDANLDIIGYKDENGNYPFLNGGAVVKGLGIEVDPFLKNDDIVVGNMQNYIVKETSPIRIDKESTIKGRKVTYGAYAIYDGIAKPNSFAYVTTPASV